MRAKCLAQEWPGPDHMIQKKHHIFSHSSSMHQENDVRIQKIILDQT